MSDTNLAKRQDKHVKILDLDKYEFDNQAFDDRWQTEVEEQLTYQFEKARQQSVSYHEKIRRSDERFVTSPAHNTILIDGDRGTGKSYFLNNIRVAWEESDQVKQSANLKSRLHFCRVIDPTLLNRQDNFTNVIIAHLYNEVRETQQQNYLNEDFNRALRELAESLEATDGESLPAGIDRIIGYRSAVDIELRFHRFIAECLNVLGVNMLVLPIDDVDMELSRAHEVLEEIRRLLSCPMILPVVSGNIALYQQLMASYFKCGAGNRKGDLHESTAESLAKDYLIKVFPENSRMPLKSVDFFCDDLVILQEGIESTQYWDYQHMTIKTMFPFTRHMLSKAHTRIKSARGLVQQVDSLKPSLLAKLCKYPSFSQYGEKDAFWHLVANTAIHNEVGTPYMIADAEQRLFRAFTSIERTTTEFLLPRISFLPIFDVKLQLQDRLKWKKEEYKVDGNLVKTFTEFPPHCSALVDAFISKDTEKELPRDFVSLFTYELTYSRSQTFRRYLNFGRAFEVLIITLLMPSRRGGIDESQLLSKTVNWMQNLSANYPFHTNVELEFGDPDSSEDERAQQVPPQLNIYKVFATKLLNWEREYGELLKQVRITGLVSICFSVFQLVFNELNELRNLSFKGEPSLQSYIRRFEYIVINAFGINLSNTQPLYSRVGLSEHSQYESAQGKVPKITRFPAIGRNVLHLTQLFLFDEDKKVFHPTRPDSQEALLLRCIWNHPIFSHFSDNIDNCIVGAKQKLSGTNAEQDKHRQFCATLANPRKKLLTLKLYRFLGGKFDFVTRPFKSGGFGDINGKREQFLKNALSQEGSWLQKLQYLNREVKNRYQCDALAFYAQGKSFQVFCDLANEAMQEENT